MDRIRAYVLRKFASTASLEVLRSPTYVEQVQEVIDRAAPIIKKKLEEIRRPRGKRSRSVDLGWGDEPFHQYIQEDRKRDNGDEEESKERRNGLTQETDSAEQEETESSLGRNGTILKRKEKKQRKRNTGSSKRSRRRKNDDVETVDRIDDTSKHNGKSKYKPDESRDTLEARLTATQNILEGISKSTSELGGAGKNGDSDEPLESEATDHTNVVSLPIVRPPSSRNSRNTTKNDTNSLTLPPISPEAPKSTKKKDELSLPVLSANHSTVKSQEQELSKDVEEASTMRDITSDIEDIAILPEDDHVDLDMEDSESKDLIPDIRTSVDEETDANIMEIFRDDVSEKYDGRRKSSEEFKELEEQLEREEEKIEEVFKDSLNVTPEIVDVLPRPDSLEPDENEIKFDDDLIRDTRLDGLKDKLMEIEMVERNIEKALDGQQLVTCNDGETMSQPEKSMTDAEINEVGMLADEAEETISEIRRSMENAEISIDEEEKKEVNDKEKAKLIGKAEQIENVEIADKTKSSSNKAEESIDIMEEMRNKAENLIKEPENSSATEMSEMEEKVEKSVNKTENLIDTTVTMNKIEKWVNGTEKLTNEIERTKNEMEIRLETKQDATVNQVETSTEIIEETVEVEKKKSDEENERSINEESSNDNVQKLVVKVDVHEDAQSVNARSQNEDDQITEAVVSENIKDETLTTNSPDKDSIDETQKKHEIGDKSPITSLAEIPFAYILSEGSPCEIPDSVTTVIIPDRPCFSPMDESQQLESTNEKEESIIHDVDRKEEKNEYGMEVFGEKIQPEIISLPIDIDFMRGMKDTKSGQNIVIVHQDLDKIKEEGEEEEEEEEEEKKDDVEEKETNSSQEKSNEQRDFVRDETVKFAETNLENIIEHEKNEEIDGIINNEAKNVEEPISVDLLAYESLSDTTKLTDTDLIDDGRADIMLESRSTLENSSEESGNTQDNHTITSSDVKESTASNQSIESSSLDRPVVPELNLDSLQDNTVSSFKMTANNTAKEDNSPRESDATTSLIEPLISDERLMNQSTSVDHEEGVPAEQFTEDLSRDLQLAPEADQLYRAEHAEYEWLEKDPLSSEITLEDEAKSQEDSIDSMALPEDIVQVGPLLQEKEGKEQLSSEEEIARELIGSLNEEMELCAKELGTKEESKDSRESFKSDLAMDDIANQVLSVSSTSIDEPEQKECEFSSKELKKLDDKDTKTEVIIDELSTHIVNISQDKNKEDTENTENYSLEESKNVKEEKEEMMDAPLAQFEQDELLEPNNKTVNEKMTIENKSNTSDIDSSDNQEKYENKETNVEEVLENQGKENVVKEKDLDQKQEENEQEEMQEENGQGNLKLEEGIVDTKAVSLETIESRKDSTNESIKNNKEPDRNDLINSDKSIVTEREVEDEKETTEEKIKEGESVQESVTSAISEQSNCPHGGYWATGTKSSTVETVIETISPNASIDKEIKADASEIIEDESFSTKKDDFYSAVVKIQACE